MVTQLIASAAFAVSLVVTPAVVFSGFATIRWDIRRIGTWSALTVRLLTLAMWGLILIDGVAVALSLRLVPLVVLAVGLVAMQLRRPIVDRLAWAPDPRRQAGLAVQRVFELASSRFRRPDADEMRRELTALDEWVTPETFEYIQLVRAHVLHWLEGGSTDAPTAARWRNRIIAIQSEWFPPAAGKNARDIPRLTRDAAKRWWLVIAVTSGIVIGIAVWVSLGPWRAAAAIALGWLVVWGNRPLVVSAGIVGALVGLALATGLRVGDCQSCDLASTVAAVAGISVVGLLCAWYLVTSEKGDTPGSELTLVRSPGEADEPTDFPPS